MDLIVFRRQVHVIDSAYDSEKKFYSLPVVGLQGRGTALEKWVPSKCLTLKSKIGLVLQGSA